MKEPGKPKQLIDVHCQRTIAKGFGTSEKKLQVTGKGLPSDGNSPNPDPQVRDHVDKHLFKQFFETLAKYPERPDAPIPKVILEFVTPATTPIARDLSSDQVQEQAIPAGQLDANSLIEEPNCSLEQVILPTETKNRIKQALTLFKKLGLIKKWGFDSLSGAIVLTGLPGTGKTSVAHAIAHALGLKILVVNFGQLESRYVGQTSDNIRKVFALAKALGVLLFIDEADGALGVRLSNVVDAAGQGLNTARNTILVEMEKCEVPLIFATNNVRAFDPAAASRLLDCIPFTLPDADCRLRIFKTHLPPDFPLAEDVSLQLLADLTDGFCGREIRNVVKKVALKTASQDCPDDDKRATMKDFVESIDEVRQGRDAIIGHKEAKGEDWMSAKVQELVNGKNNFDNHNGRDMTA